MQDSSIKLGIVVAEFNYDITHLMLDRAISHAKFLNAEVRAVFKVPGTFEIPLAVKQLLSRDDIDCVVTLGAVIKGETKHDEVIANQVARLVSDLSLEFNKPVSLGIIGPGATHEQAMERIEEYSTRAVESAVKMARRMRSMMEGSSSVNIE
ncbi:MULTISPECIES: 6,7-dimethyl-8-ribityllumazine synthase [Metallosphaera]|uniref:6,7-dimethyl-8-ribityllumazine synthase n=3 Tax=Metallosphaera TaxID=41980 RepID=RISB_METS5|nr:MULTISPECIES: 6,7-dimethyl-8-ribityllumazine synthase [Metallosphaera]A4YCS3.1 RecName: Full=6,7-dimethyl-8-ribityllumazine synthase; Short=DMRL synthase; Short=LS; Short=Lumazine synthase [Metallosphaera sedula DSM 5348]ABP94225.1 6,7-dimethyl-8-ribityllumazine synthase [Metallosphaera sedula DSM 5348]AIM26212.1 6,7-dimethyl-8-ribityllumazine synthase [Metallosphaera sedula]AKV73233.1 6,7-dimethyl-8-ribityllumazine synthase [Metallosphaera sedula]AKV75477.1 6,7-dimethyl-8-ribityllumazine s